MTTTTPKLTSPAPVTTPVTFAPPLLQVIYNYDPTFAARDHAEHAVTISEWEAGIRHNTHLAPTPMDAYRAKYPHGFGVRPEIFRASDFITREWDRLSADVVDRIERLIVTGTVGEEIVFTVGVAPSEQRVQVKRIQ